MHEAGIGHLDLHGSNILVPDSKPDDFVFIDFETAADYFPGHDLADAAKSIVSYLDEVEALVEYSNDHNFDTFEWFYHFPSLPDELS